MLRQHKFSLLICLGLILALTLTFINLTKAIAQESERVGLVIQFSDDSILTSCIDTGGQALSGLDILEISGVKLSQYYDANREVAVCSVNGQGCDANHCFCAFPDYWSYWHLENGEWVYSGRGASTSIVQPGTVDGWRWGAGEGPSKITFEEICPLDHQQAVSRPALVQPPGSMGVASQTINLAGMVPLADAGVQQPIQPLSHFISAGYLLFGFAMLAMGLGLFFILQIRQR